MKHCVTLLLFGLLVGSAAVAQGIKFGWRHAVRLDYLSEAKRAIEYARPIELPLPRYDIELVRAGIHGTATIQFVVDRDGKPRDIMVVKQSQREFGEPSKEAVSKWRFEVAKKGGPDVSSVMECKFSFRIEEE